MESIFDKNNPRCTAILKRAKKLGVIDIHFDGGVSEDTLGIYEYTLDLVEKNQKRTLAKE